MFSEIPNVLTLEVCTKSRATYFWNEQLMCNHRQYTQRQSGKPVEDNSVVMIVDPAGCWRTKKHKRVKCDARVAL